MIRHTWFVYALPSLVAYTFLFSAPDPQQRAETIVVSAETLQNLHALDQLQETPFHLFLESLKSTNEIPVAEAIDGFIGALELLEKQKNRFDETQYDSMYQNLSSALALTQTKGCLTGTCPLAFPAFAGAPSFPAFTPCSTTTCPTSNCPCPTSFYVPNNIACTTGTCPTGSSTCFSCPTSTCPTSFGSSCFSCPPSSFPSSFGSSCFTCPSSSTTCPTSSVSCPPQCPPCTNPCQIAGSFTSGSTGTVGPSGVINAIGCNFTVIRLANGQAPGTGVFSVKFNFPFCNTTSVVAMGNSPTIPVLVLQTGPSGFLVEAADNSTIFFIAMPVT